MPHVQPEASVVQVGLGIRYIGQHAYAYSGSIAAATAEQTALEFTTGSGYIFADIQCNAYLQYANVTQRQGGYKVSFNGIIVALITAPTSNAYSPSTVSQELIIPPFTEVLIETLSTADDADNFATINLVGRVYGVK